MGGRGGQVGKDVHSGQGGNEAHGRTRNDSRIAHDLERMDRGGRLRNREVRRDSEVTLPDWRPDRTPPKWQRERWGVALAALERHEATHRANARAAAEEARSRLLDKIGRASCRERVCQYV